MSDHPPFGWPAFAAAVQIALRTAQTGCRLKPCLSVRQEPASSFIQKGNLMAKKPAEQAQESEADRRKPEAVFRIGFVSASVFVHDVDSDNGKRAIRSVNLQKRYKDGDEVRYTNSFGLAELPQVLRVLQLAQQHVESREAKLELND